MKMKLPTLFKKPIVKESTQPQLTLEDVIAPAEMEVNFNDLRIDTRFFRTYFVSNYPRFVEPNWLEPLISFDHSLLISMFIEPSESAGVLDELKRKIAEMEATIQTDFERNRAIDPTVEVALEDARGLQDQLVKGVERFFQFSLYITVPSASKEELHNTSRLVESTLASLSISAKAATLQMEDGFKSSLPLGQNLLNLTHNMDTTSLATTFPFASSELTANEGIMYGINEHNDSLILFDRFSLENANSVVFAKSGAGKSVAGNESVLIQDAQGIRLSKISDLVDNIISQKGINFRDEELEGVSNPEIKVFTFNTNLKGEWSNVTIAARKDAPEDSYYFQTASGRHITVTGDHNLVVLREGKIVNLKSTETKTGDVIPVPRSIPEPGQSLEYLYPLKLLKESNLKAILFRIPTGGYRVGSKLRQLKTSLPYKIKITDRFARLLGYISAEGWVGNSYLMISNIDTEVLSDTKECLKELGLNFTEAKRKKIVCSININARVFAKFIRVIGADGRSNSKSAPGFLFNCSNQIISEYLRAYFEGDGGINQHEIVTTTKSYKLASDLSYLLLRFGIISRLRITNKKATNISRSIKQPYHQIIISGKQNLEKFAQSIGFVTKRKNKRLLDIIKQDKVANTNVDTVPTLEPILQDIFNSFYASPNIKSPINLSALKRGIFNPSPQTITMLIGEIEQDINSLLSITVNRIQYLKKLPRHSILVESGKLVPQLNTLLWQELGDSWRLTKNGLVSMGVGNALRATKVIFNENYSLPKIRREIIEAFAELGLSLQQFDPALWNYLHYRQSDRGSYERIIKAIDYLESQFNQKLENISIVQEKIAILRNLANSELYWDPIIKIKKGRFKDKYVYDLTVDNEVFLAGFGGLFVHNSYLVKLEALRSLMFGVEIIVIDPEQEYLSLAQAVGGEYINFSASSPVKINPFDLSSQFTTGENELGRKILSLTVFLKLVLGNLSATEAAILDRALKQTYQLKGITDDPKTQLNPPSGPPLMEDLYKVLIGMEESQAMELSARLERFIKGSLTGIFSAQSNIDLKNSFTVFSVRDLPDQLRPLAIHMILDYVWTKIRGKLKRRILVVDEAWYLMRNPDSADFLVDMAKRARKYYLGLTTITQDVEDFLASERGKEIISNSSIQILLKQAPSSIDTLAQVFNLSEGEQRLLMSEGIGEGLFFAGNTHVAMRVVASPQEHQLVTSNPAELLARQNV